VKGPPIGRLFVLLVGMLAGLGGIVTRLAVLQLSEAPELRSLGYDQRLQPTDLPAQRGRILDRNGELLAISLEAQDVYVKRELVVDPTDTAADLAPVLGVKPREILSRLKGSGFAFVARQVDPRVAQRIQALELPGLGLLPVSKRYYPAGPLASQVLGFVGVDGVGLDGLELQYQSMLAGRSGEEIQEVDPLGRPIATGLREVVEPRSGTDVWTTIDVQLQYRVEAALARAVAENRAKGGTVIVLDPATGDILSMAVYPTFDPNRFSEWADDPDVWKNRAVTDAVEPGSVNKVITASVAVQEHVFPLERRFVVPWRIRIGNSVIHDSHQHPTERMTLADIVAQSSNIGIVKVAEEVGAPLLSRYLSRFGFGRRTGLGFPGEGSGLLLPLDDWSLTSLPTIAFGQGISVTPLQMAAVYATIANRGTWVQPRLVRGTVGTDGTRVESPPSPSKRVVSPRTARILTQMLAYAVDEGTGQSAQIPGYQVAGKTGTARKPYADRPGYSLRYVASFIGFLPASRPRVVIAAMLDEPETVYGGLAAAPLFREIARYAIHRLEIEPGDAVPRPPSAQR
jgi:cell division protein FtsI (penicillin-binding protein 3)